MKEKQSKLSGAAVNRKCFIKGILAAGVAPIIVPASVRGANAPSNKITLGVIGLGARARTVVPSLVGLPNVRLVAMADCNLRRVRGGWAAKYVSSTYGKNHGVRTTGDFREVCTAADVDAVAVIANLHWHPYITALALRSGKHVFMEKPFAPSAEEGRLIVDAVKAAQKRGQVFQVDFQRRGMLNFMWAGELALNGELGEIKEVICATVGNKHWDHMPAQPVPETMDWNRWCGPCEVTPFNEKKLSIWPTELMSQYSPNGMAQCWGCHYLDLSQLGLPLPRPLAVLSPPRGFAPRGGERLRHVPVSRLEHDGHRGGLERGTGLREGPARGLR